MLHMCIHPNIMPTHLSSFFLCSLTYNFQTIRYVDQYLDTGFPWKEAPLKDEGQVKVIFWQPSQQQGEKCPLSYRSGWSITLSTTHFSGYSIYKVYRRSMDYKPFFFFKETVLFVPNNSLCNIFLYNKAKSSCFLRMSKK